jgi:sugar-specific transcriptional regulator TrmB
MTIDKKECLNQLGLNDRQISIYEALLRLGESKQQASASTQQIPFDTLWEPL